MNKMVGSSTIVAILLEHQPFDYILNDVVVQWLCDSLIHILQTKTL